MNTEEKNVTNKSKKWIAYALIGALVLCGIVFAFSAVRDIRGGGTNGNVVVDIPAGAGTSVISGILADAEMISHPAVFKLYVRMGKEPVYQRGRHMLNTAMSYGQIIAKLQSPPMESGTEKRITIPEGYELNEIIDLLVENGLGSHDAFMNEIENGSFDYAFVGQIPNRENRLEGYLFPETYMFDAARGEHAIIDKMLATFAEKVLPVYEAAGTSYSLDEILTMASVVEREAANDEERPTVASVFYNRIAQGMKLESCATVQYILGERKDVLTNEDTAIASPYNTYRNQGLPIGPIASPGLKSIEAALYPAETDYVYFVATEDGSQNLFSRTFEEHNRKTAEIYGGQ